MRKIFVLFLGFFVVSLSASFAQGLMDYVKSVKGDTLVVNDFTDMGALPNSINNVILADTVDVPAGRVYQLQIGGWYPQSAGLTTPANRPVVIAGADNSILVKRTAIPPIISGYQDEGGSYVGGITWSNDLTVKNISQIVGAPDGTGGWAFYGSGAADKKVVFENCMMEHNWWVFVQSNGNAGSRLYFKNNYFVNMSGRPCRRNGGIYDNVNNNTDTMYIENNTHVMAQGMIYKFRNYPVKFIYANHNTFINCAGMIFETQGVQSNVIVTNNIFVNCVVQPLRPNMTEDLSEIAYDGVPQGIIDVAVLPETMEQVPRKWLVQNNLAYWDSRVSNLGEEANSMAVNTFTTWQKQSQTMNTRTKALFDDNTNYPFMSNGTWYDQLPTFTDPKDLLTTQVDVLKAFTLSTIDTISTDVMPDWRLVSTGDGSFIYSDWPIPVDLSYSDADLKTAGTDGLPLGDLNWFTAEKANFNANKASYYSALITAFDAGTLVPTSVKELGGVVSEFRLLQNYPNPFNPTTTIDFSIPKAGNVTLKVYDALGKEIVTLVDGYKTAQSYQVEFDASSLSSGIYFYTIKTDNFTKTNKMILMK